MILEMGRIESSLEETEGEGVSNVPQELADDGQNVNVQSRGRRAVLAKFIRIVY